MTSQNQPVCSGVMGMLRLAILLSAGAIASLPGPGCVSPAPPKPAAETSFAGTWLTDDKAVRRGGFFGKITLVLEGTVSGRKLVGRWWWNSVGDASFEETVPQFRGLMEWTLSEDGDG
ncbi:MAG: hypothetical protein ACYS47_20680, partial [Planctomycetota bacterium]